MSVEELRAQGFTPPGGLSVSEVVQHSGILEEKMRLNRISASLATRIPLLISL